jgi:hypothetical protein
VENAPDEDVEKPADESKAEEPSPPLKKKPPKGSGSVPNVFFQ